MHIIHNYIYLYYYRLTFTELPQLRCTHISRMMARDGLSVVTPWRGRQNVWCDMSRLVTLWRSHSLPIFYLRICRGGIQIFRKQLIQYYILTQTLTSLHTHLEDIGPHEKPGMYISRWARVPYIFPQSPVILVCCCVSCNQRLSVVLGCSNAICFSSSSCTHPCPQTTSYIKT